MSRPKRPTLREKGFSLVEMTLVSIGISFVMGTVMLFMKSSQAAWELSGNQSGLQERARRLLHVMVDDLRRSSLTSVAGQNLPAIWERPAGTEDTPRGALIATMNYEDVDQVDEILAVNGDGQTRIERNRARESNEIVFQIPTDVDGNGIPLDADGNVEFTEDLVTYRVVDQAGTPTLMRYVERAGEIVDRRAIGPWVQKITFDVVLNDRTVRFNEIAVCVYLERIDDRGQVLRAAVEGAVGLRNTREL